MLFKAIKNTDLELLLAKLIKSKVCWWDLKRVRWRLHSLPPQWAAAAGAGWSTHKQTAAQLYNLHQRSRRLTYVMMSETARGERPWCGRWIPGLLFVTAAGDGSEFSFTDYSCQGGTQEAGSDSDQQEMASQGHKKTQNKNSAEGFTSFHIKTFYMKCCIETYIGNYFSLTIYSKPCCY